MLSNRSGKVYFCAVAIVLAMLGPIPYWIAKAASEPDTLADDQQAGESWPSSVETYERRTAFWTDLLVMTSVRSDVRAKFNADSNETLKLLREAQSIRAQEESELQAVEVALVAAKDLIPRNEIVEGALEYHRNELKLNLASHSEDVASYLVQKSFIENVLDAMGRLDQLALDMERAALDLRTTTDADSLPELQSELAGTEIEVDELAREIAETLVGSDIWVSLYLGGS